MLLSLFINGCLVLLGFSHWKNSTTNILPFQETTLRTKLPVSDMHTDTLEKKTPHASTLTVTNTVLQGPVQYLAFGWRAVCALVCVDAGRGYSSTKVTLGYARYLASWRHLHCSKLGSIQLL